MARSCATTPAWVMVTLRAAAIKAASRRWAVAPE